MMKYKGYMARVEFDDEAMLLHGEVVGTRDVITFQAQSAAEIEAEFHRSVDAYLALCARKQTAPEKPFSGQVLVRMPPDLHRDVTGIARDAGVSVNSWVVQTLEHALAPLPGKVSPPGKAAPRENVAPQGNRVAPSGPRPGTRSKPPRKSG